MKQTADGFNYTCVVVGATLLLAAVYWFFPKYGARHFFVGPKHEETLKQEKLDKL